MAQRPITGHLGRLLHHGLLRLGVDVRRHRPHPYRPRTVIAEPRTILDVGAADGTPDLYRAFPDAFVVAFEPLAEQAQDLRETLSSRSHEIVGVAVGDSEGNVTLEVDTNNPLKSSFHSRTALTISSAACEPRTVPVQPLDNLVLGSRWEPPYVLKVDTEGHDLNVLQGAAHTLTQTVVLYCEITVGHRFNDSYAFSDLAGFLIAQGFELVDILAGPRGPDGRTLFLDTVWIPRTADSSR